MWHSNSVGSFSLFTLCSLCLCGSFSSAADPKKTTYDEHVAPLLRDKCFACHNPDKKSGGLILNSYGAFMQATGDRVVVPGDPEKSSLFLAVTHRAEPFMPPKGDKLPAEQLELIRKWIAEAPWKIPAAR